MTEDFPPMESLPAAAVASPRGGLTGNALKWIAIVCMVIDHIAWAFVETASPLGLAMHFVGRVTGPTMFFFIAEGYAHTHSFKRYAGRLAVFALLSWPAFSLFETGKLLSPQLGVIWTLLVGLLLLRALDRLQSPVWQILAALAACFLSLFGDWSVYGILYILAFAKNRGSFRRQTIWFSIVTAAMILPDVFYGLEQYGWNWSVLCLPIVNLGVFLVPPLLYFYNGRRGGRPWMKWAFYVFYPAHLLVLWVFKILLL